MGGVKRSDSSFSGTTAFLAGEFEGHRVQINSGEDRSGERPSKGVIEIE